MKRALLTAGQLAFLPVLIVYVVLAAAWRNGQRKDPGHTRRLALVTPFGAGTLSGSARAVKDMVEMLTPDFDVTVIALRDLRPRVGILGRMLVRVLGGALPIEEELRGFLVDPEPVLAEVKEADLIFIEFVYGALFLFRASNIERPIVLRDHEVLARRYAGELAAARGLGIRLALVVRLATVWVLTVHFYLQADRIIALTEEDAAWLKRWYPFIGSKVSAIPVSFQASPVSTLKTETTPRAMLYAANFYHKPNVDGLLWFLSECAPGIEGEATLHLIGLDEPLAQVALPRTNLRVVRHGHIEDLERFCSDIPVALAPIVSGGGIRVKNLLFGSLSKAIVTTSLGNEGIEFEHGREALVCDRADEFAAAINRLFADPGYARLLGSNARALVESKFSQDAIRARYRSEVFPQVIQASI